MSSPTPFPIIGLIGQHLDPRVGDSMLALASHLKSRGRRVLITAGVDLPFAVGEVESYIEAQLVELATLFIAVGGDGTMLYAARLASQADIPLLGVNRGRLGFLTDVSPTEICERLDDVLEGRYVRETRALLSATLRSAGREDRTGIALNDVVLQKWDTGRILEFETWIDGLYVNTHRGDGIVVATATGSTAYALSCGGPIIRPDLEALVLAPICPHTLSDRPIVVRADSHVEIRTVDRLDTKAQVTCDGVLLGELTDDDRLLIAPAETQISLLHPPGHDYYRILRSKLHWGRGGQGKGV